MEENVEIGAGSVYEVSFLIVPSTTEEKLPEVFGTIKDLVLAKGAVAISEEFPKLMSLAYTMEKTINNKIERFREGYFGWIKFETEGENIASLDAALRLRSDVIRHLIVSTVRENTMSQKRGFGMRRRSKEEGVEGKDAPQMTKEQIDAEIEALVDDKEASA